MNTDTRKRLSSLPALKRRPRMLLAVPAVIAGAVIMAACSSSPGNGVGPYGPAAPSTPAATAPAAGGAGLMVRHTSLGTILTDGQGFTVYAFEADKGTRSQCSGACAAAWPPVTTATARCYCHRRRQVPGRRDDPAWRRPPAHLCRAPAVSLHWRHQPRCHQRPGPGRLRRPLGRARPRRHGGNRRLAPAPPPDSGRARRHPGQRPGVPGQLEHRDRRIGHRRGGVHPAPGNRLPRRPAEDRRAGAGHPG